jgi:peptidoglycan/LPS O-acetylase OafA/YrhL
MESPIRNARIDALRGLAIAAVLLLHFNLAYHLSAGPNAAGLGPRLLRALTINGNFGVTMFFAISGFLITNMAMTRFGSPAEVRPRTFYAFRFARIMPSLALALGLIVLLSLAGLEIFQNTGHGACLPGSSYLTVLLSVLTFWHNVLMAYRGYFNYCVNIYWSLSVEEVFYLAFPLACLLLKRRRWLLGLCALLIVIGPVYRHLHPDDDIQYLYAYLACFDAIAMGCAAALLAPRLPRPGRILQAAAALLVAAVFLRGISGHVDFGFSLIGLGTAILLLGSGSGSGRISGNPWLGWLRWLGRHSYELYLFHIIVLALMLTAVPRKVLPAGWKPAWLLVFLGLSAILAWTVARFWSAPLNGRIRERLT